MNAKCNFQGLIAMQDITIPIVGHVLAQRSSNSGFKGFELFALLDFLGGFVCYNIKFLSFLFNYSKRNENTQLQISSVHF